MIRQDPFDRLESLSSQGSDWGVVDLGAFPQHDPCTCGHQKNPASQCEHCKYMRAVERSGEEGTYRL